jgi:hypothetical protein
MTSAAQVAANKRNAQKSTGPRTDAGKARSRLNPIRHGGYLSINDHISATLLGEDEDLVATLRNAIVADLAPRTTLESTQAYEIAEMIIGQRRISKLTAPVASADEISSEEAERLASYRILAQFWRQISEVVAHDHAPAEPSPTSYRDLVTVLRQFVKQDRLLSASQIGKRPPDGSDSAAWCKEIRRLASVYFDGDDVIDQVFDEADKHQDTAAREERRLAGIESRRLLETFDKTTSLQDRIARRINRQLTAYRELQASHRPNLEPQTTEPRNEPNPNM